MSRPRGRVTVRRLMLAIAIAALTASFWRWTGEFWIALYHLRKSPF